MGGVGGGGVFGTKIGGCVCGGGVFWCGEKWFERGSLSDVWGRRSK